MIKSNYSIVSDIEGKPLIIRDEGPWDKFMSVTNDVEQVVEELYKLNKLPEGRRLFCYDSNGDLDEFVVENGEFVRFKVGSR